MKYSFVNFLSNFSSFQCLYIVRSEWDIVLSSSYDGWDTHGHTMWCTRKGASKLLITSKYSSKLRLIVSKGGANSAGLKALRFYF